MVPFTSEVLSKVAGFGKPRPDISWLSVSLLWNHCRDFRSFGSEALIGALQETHKTVFRADIRAKSTSFGQDAVPRGNFKRLSRGTITIDSNALWQHSPSRYRDHGFMPIEFHGSSLVVQTGVRRCTTIWSSLRKRSATTDDALVARACNHPESVFRSQYTGPVDG